MAAPNFTAGDVVRLKSGSPPMTVEKVSSSGEVHTIWFPLHAGEEGVFQPEPKRGWFYAMSLMDTTS